MVSFSSNIRCVLAAVCHQGTARFLEIANYTLTGIFGAEMALKLAICGFPEYLNSKVIRAIRFA